MVTPVYLTQGYIALVDDEDAERIKGESWHAAVDSRTRWYVRVMNGQNVPLEHFILGITKDDLPPYHVVDHENGYALDCQKKNLRVVTVDVNAANRHQQTLPKGATQAFHTSGRNWKAQLYAKKKQIFLGYWHTKEEALAAVAYYREHGKRIQDKDSAHDQA